MAKRKVVVLHPCRECVHCVPVMKPFNLLSLKGEPTLGRCPYWTESRSFLLGQRTECRKWERGEQFAPPSPANTAK